jgi:hypothetical protein
VKFSKSFKDFCSFCAFFINQPPEAANESPSLLGRPIGHQNEPETSLIYQDIARRWQAQRMLEEMIAAVRQGNADAVLALLESPVVQASFTRDRAAFLSFLAILSSSSQRALLDYVRQALDGSATRKRPGCRSVAGLRSRWRSAR